MTMPDEAPTPSRVRKLSTVVETFDLARRFGSVTAVAGVSMTVNSSEIFGLIGPNGAGKSTLINISRPYCLRLRGARSSPASMW